MSHEKITVTYEGAGDEFVPLDRDKAKEDVARKHAKSMANSFCTLDDLQARKNLMRLVHAYACSQSRFSSQAGVGRKEDSCFNRCFHVFAN